ncbi:hypothetical protein BDF22DRAFT_666004 [Syncephalis plumigaleata]|nr:hypothetical protein BDF22DRAFT_666004 [Syncephalis plumigaleata]
MQRPHRRQPNKLASEYASLLVGEDGSIDNLPSNRVIGFHPNASPGSVSYPGGNEASSPLARIHNSRNQMNTSVGRSKIKPSRTSRTSQKMALFPVDEDNAYGSFDEMSGADRPVYDQVARLPQGTVKRDVEQLRQLDRSSLPRMTAYCTASSYRLDQLFKHFQSIKVNHSTAPKLFDECLYSPYSFTRRIDDDNAPSTSSHAANGGHLTSDSMPLTSPTSPIDPNARPDDDASEPLGEIFQEGQLLLRLAPFEDEKLPPDEIELEEFHFYYNKEGQPRIYNDIITLRSATNYMAKLTISHAVAQSTKLALFEGLVDNTIDTTKHIPWEMARTGNSNMTRTAISKKIGQLFIMRINVNLVSNVLDTPEIFWSEPAFQPLYDAIKGYLEISQRVELLNQRVTVISDLLDMLREHLNSRHGERLEWIVIYLIALEIVIGLITISLEVFTDRKVIPRH